MEMHRIERLAAQAADKLADASPEEILRWALETFRDRVCVTSSMTDAVIIHMASAMRPGIDVIFLDTGYHFAETIGTRNAVAAVYPVTLIDVVPAQTVPEQDAEFGLRLYARNPDLCCHLRKVEPLERALSHYDAWITGVRRDETVERRAARPVEWDDRREMAKINPIVSWSQQQVDDYIAENGVLVNPLLYDGYPSIGCSTCTRRVAPGEDPRSGRWAGTGKAECGIHLLGRRFPCPGSYCGRQATQRKGRGRRTTKIPMKGGTECRDDQRESGWQWSESVIGDQSMCGSCGPPPGYQR